MGVATQGPRVVWFLLAGTLAALGLPFFATFPGLLMVLFGSLQNEPVGTLVMAGGLVVAAAAIAWLLRRALFGRPNADAPPPSDSTMPQAWYLGILIGVLLWVGLLPSGPKLAGNVVFDPGMINVITQETTTITAPYVPPASTSSSSTP
jgi:NADH:ubiquinone oxidoreductase subunit 4 (subunit M)